MVPASMDRTYHAQHDGSAEGFSIILCCHNSAHRLPETLRAISSLLIPAQAPIEVLLIDNASTDHTGQVALETWRGFSAEFSLRVICEPTPGLMHARRTGIREARFALLVFCDDDNLLSSDYLFIAHKHFSDNPLLGALGGFGIPVFEQEPPAWFWAVSSAYATGSQQITGESGRTLNLYGAGLVVRKTALECLYSMGYHPLLTGRRGNQVTGAEDTEMTYALVIAGYTLHYDDAMQFRHLLPPSRLTEPYLEKLFLSSAVDGPVRNLYHAFVTKRTIPSMMKRWLVHLAVAICRIPKYLCKPPRPGFRLLYFRWNIRYLQSLIAFRPQYQAAMENIARIPRCIPARHVSDKQYRLQPKQIA
jgi:glycosyltransferase involved in cell wall biosynthesis